AAAFTQRFVVSPHRPTDSFQFTSRITIMSSLMQARWQRFKQHKLGFGCFIIFSVIFIISLGAELIANDKTLLVKYDHAFYLPILYSYPETTYGGFFNTEPEYKDPAVQQPLAEKGWANWP